MVKVCTLFERLNEEPNQFYEFQLEIEMCMSRLILKVARGTGLTIYVSPPLCFALESAKPNVASALGESRPGNSG